MAREDWVLIPRAVILKSHERPRGKKIKMANVICFRLFARHSFVKCKNASLPSPKMVRNWKELVSKRVPRGFMCNFSQDFQSEKGKQDDRRPSDREIAPYLCLGLAGILYAVVFGPRTALCIGEDSVASTKSNNDSTPSGEVEQKRDSSGRFSSLRKDTKTKNKKRLATDLLKAVNAAKRRLVYEEEQREEEHEVSWKGKTRSVTVSLLCFHLVCVLGSLVT